MLENLHTSAIVLTRSQISAHLRTFATRATLRSCATFDIIIENHRLAWRPHSGDASPHEIICTYQTIALIEGLTLFDSTANLARIENAIYEHNAALEN